MLLGILEIVLCVVFGFVIIKLLQKIGILEFLVKLIGSVVLLMVISSIVCSIVGSLFQTLFYRNEEG